MLIVVIVVGIVFVVIVVVGAAAVVGCPVGTLLCEVTNGMRRNPKQHRQKDNTRSWQRNTNC